MSFVAPNGSWPVGPWRRGINPADKLAVEHVAAIAVAIRVGRAARYETQQQLADTAGVSVATVVRIENGRTWPDVLTVWRLLGTLGIKHWPPPDR